MREPVKLTRLLIGCKAIDLMADYSETQTVGKMPCLTDSLFVRQPVIPKKTSTAPNTHCSENRHSPSSSSSLNILVYLDVQERTKSGELSSAW